MIIENVFPVNNLLMLFMDPKLLSVRVRVCVGGGGGGGGGGGVGGEGADVKALRYTETRLTQLDEK